MKVNYSDEIKHLQKSLNCLANNIPLGMQLAVLDS